MYVLWGLNSVQGVGDLGEFLDVKDFDGLFHVLYVQSRVLRCVASCFLRALSIQDFNSV